MLNSLAQQFLGGGAESMAGPELHGNVGQMAQNSSNDLVTDAIGTALKSLGPQGFGQSVSEGAGNAAPQQRSTLANLLLDAVEKGGGSRNAVASQYGVRSGGSGNLAQMAIHVAENHPQMLAQVLGNHVSNSPSGGGSVMALLGNPMVRQIGMHLARQYL